MLSSHELSQERSSQESLPLSQETFQTLVNGLFELGHGLESFKNATDLSKKLEDNGFLSDKQELVPYETTPVPCVPLLTPIRASVPAVSDWSGVYDFKVFFDEKEPLSKKVLWTYSAAQNRLYVKKGQLCPFNVSTNCPMGEGTTYLRATLVYSMPQFSNEAVKRCLLHSRPEIEAGVVEAEHLIRSSCAHAEYLQDELTLRHSVIVPFEDPTVGQNFSSYLFKFLCYNSCPGGPNRRQMTIIFTLERINNFYQPEIVGRKCMSLKVCACPGRDRSADEGSSLASEQLEASYGSPPKKKFKENHVVPTNVLNHKSNPSCKKQRDYLIKVKDQDTYKFLLEMKKVTDLETRGFLMHMKNCRELFLMSKEQQNFLPILNAYVNYVSSNSCEERSEEENL